MNNFDNIESTLVIEEYQIRVNELEQQNIFLKAQVKKLKNIIINLEKTKEEGE
nr:MAG TPA: B-ZIP transcription factor [Caudoviricetes sp.]